MLRLLTGLFSQGHRGQRLEQGNQLVGRISQGVIGGDGAVGVDRQAKARTG